MATPDSTAFAHTRCMIEASLAWKPQGTLALVTTRSSASSSPSVHWPKPSPRSEFRSTRQPPSREEVDHRADRLYRQVDDQQPGDPADRAQPAGVAVAAQQVAAPGGHDWDHGDAEEQQHPVEGTGEDHQRRQIGADGQE